MKTLLIVLAVIVVGSVFYIVTNPGALQTPATDDTKISWKFENRGEVDGMPQTNVDVMLNGTTYSMGNFTGTCSEVKENGGIDGTGLLAGELSAVQCWFAGSGDEIGVFAHEDGGYQIMVGELGEGDEGRAVFRGNFEIKHDIRP